MTTPADLTDEAKAEIAEAVRIVASDKGFAMMQKVHNHLIPPTPETDPPKDGDPTAPPKKDNAKPDEMPKRRGLWNVGNSDESE
jgi:hypothetical protein